MSEDHHQSSSIPPRRLRWLVLLIGLLRVLKARTPLSIATFTTTFATLFVFGLAILQFSNAHAANQGINRQLNYQGKLTSSIGTAVANESWSFRFRIYDASTGGNTLWTERWVSTTTQVSTVGGVFSVELGSLGQADSLADIDWNTDSLWLQVDLDADGDGSFEESFATRKRLSATPYAFNADELDGLSATSTATIANYLVALDTNATLNLYGEGVSSTYATSSWLYVAGGATVKEINATTTNVDVLTVNDFLRATSSFEFWFNNTSTWHAFDALWNTNFNTTSTWAGFDDSFDTRLNATSTWQGGILVSGAATTTGKLVVSGTPVVDNVDFYVGGHSYFGGNITATGNLTVNGYATTSNIYTSGILHVGSTSVFDGTISGSGFDGSVNSLVDSRISGTWRGAANGLASLGADGKVPNSQLGPLAITDTFVVASEAAMLALSSAGVGDVAIRTDIDKSYILKESDYSILANWEELLTPADGVVSFNGEQGVVVVNADDIAEGFTNLYFTDTRVDSRISGSWRGLANGLASLDSAGKVPTSQLPDITINNTYVVADQAARLALTANIGDIAVQTDTSTTYVLAATPASSNSNWVELLNSAAVDSVNGYTGSVSLSTSDISEGSRLYWTNARFDARLNATTTWAGNLQLTSGNLGVGIDPSFPLEVVGVASTTDNVYIGKNLYVGHASDSDSDVIYFDHGDESLTWNQTTARFEFTDDLYVTGVATSSQALWIGTNSTADYVDLSGGDLLVQDDIEYDGELFGNLARLSLLNATSTNIDSLRVYGNATSSNWFNIGSTDVVGTLGNLIGAGDLFIGDDATVTDSLSVGGNLIVSGTATTTLAGNIQIANGKDLQVSRIYSYSPLQIRTDLDVYGAATTTGKLVVSGTPTVDNVDLYVGGDSYLSGAVTVTGNLTVLNGLIEDTENEDLVIRTNSNGNQLVLDSAGSVGLGTASPQAKLELSESGATNLLMFLNQNNASDYDSIIGFRKQGTTKGYIGYDNADDLIKINSGTGFGGTTHLVVKNGYVGVGTTSPSTLLNLYGTSVNTTTGSDTVALRLHNISAGAFNRGTEIQFVQGTGEYESQLANIRSIYTGWTGGPPVQIGGDLVFSTKPTIGSLTERVRITRDGNLGIGDSSPAQLLTVGNGDLFTVDSSGNATSVSLFSPVVSIGAAANHEGLEVKRVGGTGTTFAKFTEAGGAFTQFVDGTGIQLDMRDTDVISRILLDTNGDSYIAPASGNVYFNPAAGNVGVGDATPASLFTVGNGDRFQIDTNGNVVKINNVTYSWPASQGTSGQVLTNNGSGTLSWSTVSSAGGGWTDGGSTVYLGDANDNVSIGTNSAVGSNKLTVEGNIILSTNNDSATYTRTITTESLNSDGGVYPYLNITTGTDGNGGVSVGGDVRVFGGDGFVDGNVILAYNGSAVIGKVGIGKSPSVTLDVNGAAAIAGDLTGINNLTFASGASRKVSIANSGHGNIFNLSLTASDDTDSSGVGGDIYLYGGDGFSTGGDGNVYLGYTGSTVRGKVYSPSIRDNTSASAANVYVDATTGLLYRSTSSRKYKTDVDYEGVDGNLLYQLQPVSYKDKNSLKEYLGFVAEDVAIIESRLVDYDAQGNPDALHYGQFTSLIVAALKDLKLEVDELKLEVATSSGELAEQDEKLPVTDSPDLDIPTLVVRQAATFYGTITVVGEAGFEHKVTFFDDVEIRGKIYASTDQAGTVVINAGATSTEVVFTQPYAVIPKVTALPKGRPASFFWASDQTPRGFRLNLAEPQSTDLAFDWIALAVMSDSSSAPPVIEELVTSLTQVSPGIPVELWARVTDADTSEVDLSYTWQLSPPVGTVEGNSGLVYWTVPENAQVSADGTDITVTVRVSDGVHEAIKSAVVRVVGTVVSEEMQTQPPKEPDTVEPVTPSDVEVDDSDLGISEDSRLPPSSFEIEEAISDVAEDPVPVVEETSTPEVAEPIAEAVQSGL